MRLSSYSLLFPIVLLPLPLQAQAPATAAWSEPEHRHPSGAVAALTGGTFAMALGALGGLVICQAAEAETDRHVCALGGAAYTLPVGAVAGFSVRQSHDVRSAIVRGSRWAGIFTFAAAVVVNGIAAHGDGKFAPDAILLASAAGSILGGAVGGLTRAMLR